MKLFYLANMRLPTEKAHGAQIMHMCKAFSEEGYTVTLVVPRRKTNIVEDAWTYYGMQESFRIVRLPVIDLVPSGQLGFWIETALFALVCFFYTVFQRGGLIYGRDEFVLLPLALVRKNVVWEAHMPRGGILQKLLTLLITQLVVISAGLKNFYIHKGVRPDRITVAHDGVDLRDFEQPESREVARMRLGLPYDKPIVMYVGRLDTWKGVETLLMATKEMDSVQTVIIGEGEHLQRFKEVYTHAKFLGALPYRDLRDNQQAADVLVIPNSGKSIISRVYTSPLKVFAHMASAIPIVVSDLPSMREILSEDSATFAKPDNPESFTFAITNVLDTYDEAKKKAAYARELVEEYTWQARAQKIRSRIL